MFYNMELLLKMPKKRSTPYRQDSCHDEYNASKTKIGTLIGPAKRDKGE
jgi:hypothetical protein